MCSSGARHGPFVVSACPHTLPSLPVSLPGLSTLFAGSAWCLHTPGASAHPPRSSLSASSALMASLLASIPAPTRDYSREGAGVGAGPSSAPVTVSKAAPPYGSRQGFVPRRLEDFGGVRGAQKAALALHGQHHGRGQGAAGRRPRPAQLASSERRRHGSLLMLPALSLAHCSAGRRLPGDPRGAVPAGHGPPRGARRRRRQGRPDAGADGARWGWLSVVLPRNLAWLRQASGRCVAPRGGAPSSPPSESPRSPRGCQAQGALE